MGSQRTYNVAINELSTYIDMPKVIRQDVIFTHEPRKSKKSPYGHHVWESSYILSAHDTIEGLILRLKSQIIYDEWYHSFSLDYQHNGTRNIIRQLEVYPPDFLSHREKNGIALFGTHMHELGKVTQDFPDGYDKYSWHCWFNWYCTCTHINICGTVQAPNEGLLL